MKTTLSGFIRKVTQCILVGGIIAVVGAVAHAETFKVTYSVYNINTSSTSIGAQVAVTPGGTSKIAVPFWVAALGKVDVNTGASLYTITGQAKALNRPTITPAFCQITLPYMTSSTFIAMSVVELSHGRWACSLSAQ